MMNKFGRNPTKDIHYEFENDQRNSTSQTNLYENQSVDIEKDNSNGQGKLEKTTSEDSFTRFYADAEVWSSNRLRKDKNIYANRYNDTSKRFRGFWHLMFQWKGGVLKLIFHDLLMYIFLWMTINYIYRFYIYEKALECDHKETCNYEIARQWFEMFCVYCGRFRHLIPITFLTGFYVSEVVKRYWDQFMNLPYPDRLALKLITYVPGKDEFRRNLRLTIMRYVNLSTVLVFRLVSTKVCQRFPNYQSLVEARLMLPHEVERLIHADLLTPHESTWTPMLWALKLLERARTEGKIKIEAPVWSSLIGGFEYLEIHNRKLLNYGWVNFPIAYTQVATLSVFAYFFFALFGAQDLIPQEEVQDRLTFPNISDHHTFSSTDPMKHHTPTMYFPFFTTLEFISYMGWIKVAETLINPFGDDDEDFQINYLIDRNFQVSRLIVDEADMEMEMATDPFLEAGIEVPATLPYQDSYQKEESTKKVTGIENDDNSLAGKLKKISNWGGRSRKNSETGTIKSNTFSRRNSVYHSHRSQHSYILPQETKASMSDRVEAANLKSRLAIVKDEIRQTNLKRTDTSNSMVSQSGKVQNKRISFQEDINRNSKIFDQSVIESAKAQSQKAQEHDINQIQEDTKEDVTVSSISSQPLSTI